MARIDLPESRLKLRKRRRRIRLSLVCVGLALLLCGAVVGLSYVPALQIRTIEVVGAETLDSGSIERLINAELDGHYAWIISKRNIFLYPKRLLNETLLSQYPVLASADVHASDFHTLEAFVVERQPRALWCPSTSSGQADCYFMDENGVVYGQAPNFSEPVYVPYVGSTTGEGLPKQFLSAESFQALAAFVDAAQQKLSSETVHAVSVDKNHDVDVSFESGFVLRFSLNDHGGDVFERFSLALTSEPFKAHPLGDFSYLDLRFGDKLYYKLKNE